MTKPEYLEKNLDAVLSLDITPFKNIDTLEKGLFNYQYYNAMAKSEKAQSTVYNDYELKKERLERADYYYRRKDKATLEVLKILEYKNITSYFIKVRSKHLKDRLFEIVINKYQMVLHSKNEYILKRLREEYIFTEGTRVSVIDSYINQKY